MLNNLTIRRKLSAGFGFVLILVAAGSLLSLLRFHEIRDVYLKTGLIYNINIEVFQAKINRLKFLHGDDPAGQLMADYVRHAAELTAGASRMSWSVREAQIISDITRHLDEFRTSIVGMQKATGDMHDARDALDKATSEDPEARYSTLLRTLVADQSQTDRVREQLFAISAVRDAARVVRYSPTQASGDALESHFSQTQKSVQALAGQLPGELQVPLRALWDNTSRYHDLSRRYLDAFLALEVAEERVKTGGDDSSAALRQLITLVNADNDELTSRASMVTLTLGVIAVLLGVLVSGWVVRQITRSVDRNLALAERIAGGDLSAQIDAQGNDELGQLTAAMGRMNDTLRGMIHQVRDSVSRVSRAATEIAEGNTDLSSRTEQQATAVVETAASMEELTATVKSNAESARHARGLAAQAAQTATEGGTVMHDVVNTMSDILSSADRITDITAVINSIAFQTNILALNAAVEAARAGVQGRGFAVVASEVRSLSQRSSQAARDIERLISESVLRITAGSELVTRAGKTVNQVVLAVGQMNDIMDEISSASEEQRRGIEQIARAVGELDSTTQQNASLVSQSAAAAHTLEEQARQLESLVAAFRIEKAPDEATLTPDAQYLSGLTPVAAVE